MTDNETNQWDEAPEADVDAGAGGDDLGLEEAPTRSRKRRWLWLLVPLLVGAGVLVWLRLRPPLEPLTYEPVPQTFGFEELKQIDMPRSAAIERIEVVRVPRPPRPEPTHPEPVRPEPARPEPVWPEPPRWTGPPDIVVAPPVRPDGPPDRVPGVTVEPTTRPHRTSPPDTAVTPGVDDPRVVVVPDPTTRGSDDPAEVVVVPDPDPRAEPPAGTGTAEATSRYAVEPGVGTGTGEAGGWRLEGLARTGPMEPGQDPHETIPKPPDYFKPENMRDGFLILSQVPSTETWKLNRDDLFVRRFNAAGSKPCVDFIWPGEGHLKDAEGTLPPEGSFWIRPRQKKGNYSRYFDNQKADFYHWAGIEIPPEHKDKAPQMFEWKLASPTTPPPGWQPAGKVYEYRRGDKVRYMYVYQMPMGPLSSGVTNVDLRLYHKESGAYLGKESHSVTIGGSQ